MTIEFPKYVRFILATLRRAGYEAYAVGGCVRDSLLGRRPHDWDVTTAAPAEEVQRLFRKTAPTGLKFGTVTVLTSGGRCEVTTFRADGAYRDARRPESVRFLQTVEGDLSRRDFTVNAMAADLSGAVTDLFGGREDLRRGLIRAVGDPAERFREDALRMLRAVRFSAQLGFTVEEKTLAALKKCAPLAEKLSAERVREELMKLLASPRPERASDAVACGLLTAWPVHDADFSGLTSLPKTGDARLCAFARLSGGGEALLTALKAPGRTLRLYAAAEKALGDPAASDARRLVALHGEAAALLAGQMSLTRGDGRLLRGVRREIRRGGFVTPDTLALSGRELLALGLRGPQIAGAKRALALAASLGEVPNDPAALLTYYTRR